MKSDQELNRLIAERVLGYRFEPHTVTLGKDEIVFDGYAPNGAHWQRDGGDRYLNYCTDPAAWGALYIWLCEQGERPKIWHDGDEALNGAMVMYSFQTDPLPGRALVLATLAAYGVEEVE